MYCFRLVGTRRACQNKFRNLKTNRFYETVVQNENRLGILIRMDQKRKKRGRPHPHLVARDAKMNLYGIEFNRYSTGNEI